MKDCSNDGSSQQTNIFTIISANKRTPVKFFLYTDEDDSGRTISKKHAEGLRRKIERNGGQLVRSELNADTIIVATEEEAKEYRERFNNCTNNIYVEPTEFVSRCISEKKYHHRPPVYKGMGGRGPTGNQARPRRVDFTAGDEQHLVEYLAVKVPVNAAGGRFGNNLYLRLVELADEYPDMYGWAKRHTWQSWRERYKIHAARLSQRIDEYVDEHPELREGKGRYFLDRRYGHGKIYEQGQDEEEEPEQGEEQEEEEEMQRKRRRPYEEEEDVRKPPMNRRRHTETIPRRHVPIEQPRQVRSFSAGDRQRGRAPIFDNSSDEEYQQKSPEFEPFDVDIDVRPGPEEAGPSGTQRSPEFTPSPLSKDRSPFPESPVDVPQSSLPNSQVTLVATQNFSASRPLRRRAPKRVNLSPPTSSPAQEPPQPQEPSPSPEVPVIVRPKPKPRKNRKRINVLQIEPVEAGAAPFRNTRSRARSQSVEQLQNAQQKQPQTQSTSGLEVVSEEQEEIAPVKTRGKNNKGKGKASEREDTILSDEEKVEDLLGTEIISGDGAQTVEDDVDSDNAEFSQKVHFSSSEEENSSDDEKANRQLFGEIDDDDFDLNVEDDEAVEIYSPVGQKTSFGTQTTRYSPGE
ncbi:hypothetical protein ABKN59_003674 [Abortiporus biennis]